MQRDLDRLAPAALALLGVAAARLIAAVALRDVPHVMDEIAYMLQARMFAGGHLTLPVHLPRGAFMMWFVDDRVRTFSIFPPGWPAVLALGVRTGLLHWLNPILHGATTLLVAHTARTLGGPRAAVTAAAVYGLSPQAVLLAASLMSHTLVALAAAVVIAAGVAVTRGAASSRHWAAMGAAVGVAAVTRPLCGIALAGVAGLFALLAMRRHGLRLPDLAAAAAPLLVLVGLLCAYNAHLTGHPLRFPQDAFFDEHLAPSEILYFQYHPGCNRLGFGPGHGCELLPEGMHTTTNATRNTFRNLAAWFWLAGGGPLAFLLPLLGLTAKTGDRAARAAILSAVPAAIFLYGLYWNPGTCYGARFYHAALPALLLLAALGIERIAARRRWLGALVLALVLAWNAGLGRLAAAEVSGTYWGTDDRFARLAAAWQEPPALVLVAYDGVELRGHYRYTTYLSNVPWGFHIRALAALGVNRPDLGGPVVFARYHPGLMPELRARFPERRLWLYVIRTGAPDLLAPYTGVPALERTMPPPPDNFEGFIVRP